MNTVEAYYDHSPQNEWERFNRHRVEFAVTRRAMARYLPPPPAQILDCGGGPGRYAIELARQGYRVTLLDLAQGNLDLARDKAAEAGVEIAAFVHGNALDLTQFSPAQFDAVLLMGPLYHLLSLDERCRAVHEALRVLRPGGPLLAAFINLYAPFRDALAKGYLHDYVADTTSTEQLLELQAANPGFTDAWFARPAEVRPWMESFGLETQALLAVEGIASGHEQHLNAASEADFEFWADLTFRFSQDPYLLGAADHFLYVGKQKNCA